MRGPVAGPGQGWTWRESRASGDAEFAARNREEGSARSPGEPVRRQWAAQGTREPGRAARGPPRVPRLGAGCPGLTMEVRRREGTRARGRAAPGKVKPGTRGGGGEDAWTRAPQAAASPGPARRRLGPGTPLRFSFRGARCRRAPRFPREMAAPARLAWGSPGFPLCAGKKKIIRKGGIKVKWLRRKLRLRRAPVVVLIVCGARRAGTGPASRGSQPALEEHPSYSLALFLNRARECLSPPFLVGAPSDPALFVPHNNG